MKRALVVAVLVAAGLFGRPSPAAADVTFFLGMSPKPEVRPTRGLAVGINMLILGFEFDYSNTSANEAKGAPGLQTGMMNALLMTPTHTQVYVTAGAGVFRESLGGASETNFGTNVGGGIKFSLLGPLQIRIDYRLFSLRGNSRYTRPQRVYAGLNIPF